jgi:DNA-binding MarR family transcriptional regulator
MSTSTVAALSSLYNFLEGATLDDLRSVLGLSHSGAVRLVDRLADAGLARRGPGRDNRSRSVTLTEQGTELAAQITKARLDAIDRLTAGLGASERRTLVELLSRVLANVVATKDGGAWTCRLCSVSACGRGRGLCPAANTAAERFSSHQ